MRRKQFGLFGRSTAAAAVGIDGLHPAHLLDLVAVSTAEAALHFRRSITILTNETLRGDISDYAVKQIFHRNSPL